MSDLVAPEQCLPVAFDQCGEGAARPKRIAHIADGSFHTSFLIARAHLAGPRRKVIVRTELSEGYGVRAICRAGPSARARVGVRT